LEILRRNGSLLLVLFAMAKAKKKKEKKADFTVFPFQYMSAYSSLENEAESRQN